MSVPQAPLDHNMEYSFFAPAQSYDFYNLPQKPVHPFTPQDDFANDPIDSYTDPTAFHSFDQSYQFQPMAPQQPQSPPHSLHASSLPGGLSTENSNETPIDIEGFEQANAPRSSDEEKELTPAQNRRKAQNRAAQRAFRERKERHVRDLEVKLSSLSATNTQISSEKERLQREVERLATQNEILRATSSAGIASSTISPSARENSPIPGPQAYTPSSFHAALTSNHSSAGAEISHRVGISSRTGEKLLATGATWDLIQGHELYQIGRVDVAEVCDRLRNSAVCDGWGPVYKETDVRRVIEECAVGATDELI